MLDPDYLLRISEGCETVAEQLHDEIIKRIVRSVAIRIGRGDDYLLTPKDKWMIEALQEAGYLRQDIEKEIAKKTGVQLSEMQAAFNDAGVETLKYDDAVYVGAGLSPKALNQSPALLRILQRGYTATYGEWINFTRTTADAAQELFIRECDKAYNLVASGNISYTEAYKQAINAIAKDGVTVTYPTGHKDSIETATLRCVRTGISQACAGVTTARMDEMDWDIVLTSAHLGARIGDGGDNFTNHSWWQGRFFSRSGSDKRFPPFSVCGEGDVQGICGANCRHSYGPGDGEHNPYEKFPIAENEKAYLLSQRQRLLERRIRKTKREVLTLREAADAAAGEAKSTMELGYQQKAALLQKQNGEYKSFCQQHDLKTRQERLTIAAWNRQQAAKATAAAKKYNSKG